VAGADIDTIGTLVDRSLVRRTDDDRLFLLETIREFARSRLVDHVEDEAVRVGGLAAAAAASGDREATASLWGAFERMEDEWGRASTFERPYYADAVGDVSAHPAYAEARKLPAAEALRLVEAYVDSL
jgi:hypothetical protein